MKYFVFWLFAFTVIPGRGVGGVIREGRLLQVSMSWGGVYWREGVYWNKYGSGDGNLKQTLDVIFYYYYYFFKLEHILLSMNSLWMPQQKMTPSTTTAETLDWKLQE